MSSSGTCRVCQNSSSRASSQACFLLELVFFSSILLLESYKTHSWWIWIFINLNKLLPNLIWWTLLAKSLKTWNLCINVCVLDIVKYGKFLYSTRVSFVFTCLACSPALHAFCDLHVLRALQSLIWPSALVSLFSRTLCVLCGLIALPYTPCVFNMSWNYTCPTALPTLLVLGVLGFYSYFIKRIVLKRYQISQ